MENNKEERYFRFMGIVFPVYTSLLVKLTVLVWISMLVLLLISTAFFQYQMTGADLPCGAIAGILLAYLITLLIR
jgi:hypothetical protein